MGLSADPEKRARQLENLSQNWPRARRKSGRSAAERPAENSAENSAERSAEPAPRKARPKAAAHKRKVRYDDNEPKEPRGTSQRTRRRDDDDPPAGGDSGGGGLGGFLKGLAGGY